MTKSGRQGSKAGSGGEMGLGSGICNPGLWLADKHSHKHTHIHTFLNAEWPPALNQ